MAGEKKKNERQQSHIASPTGITKYVDAVLREDGAPHRA